MLAFPLAAVMEVGNQLKAIGNVGIELNELAFLMDTCRDNHGPLSLAKTIEAIVSN